MRKEAEIKVDQATLNTCVGHLLPVYMRVREQLDQLKGGPAS